MSPGRGCLSRYGIDLAKSYGATVISLYVIDEATLSSLERLSGQDAQTLRRKLRKEGEVCLHNLHQRATEEGVELTEIVKEGLPYRVIVELAQEEGGDLIVIGRVGQRSRGAFSSALSPSACLRRQSARC